MRIIGNGESQTVGAGQTDTGDQVLFGGALEVLAGGKVFSTTIYTGGVATIDKGGVDTGTLISGGIEYNYGRAVDDTIVGNTSFTGYQYVEPGAVALRTTLDGPCWQYVEAGATTLFTADHGGGVVLYGKAVGVFVDQGGDLDVDGGRSFDTRLGDGGNELVFANGVASHTLISSGGNQNVYVDGTAKYSTINTGGFQEVYGGTVIGTIINSGGKQSVLQQGIAWNTTVNSGGEQIVYEGFQNASVATAINTTVESGGLQFLYGYGVAKGTTIKSGGVQEVGQATAIDTIIGNGGLEKVDALGTTIGSNVARGGTEHVFSGGTTLNTTINGGTLELDSGASTGNAPVQFGFGGTLKLNDAESFQGAIANFRGPDRIDLVDIAFGANDTINFVEAADHSSATLTVSDNVNITTLLLVGRFATSFHLEDDGHGGTLVVPGGISGHGGGYGLLI